MSPQELALLGALVFLATASASFVFHWLRRPALDETGAPAQWDWFDIAELARTAVKDAEQLWLKEGLPKEQRLAHALALLLEAYPQLAPYKTVAAAFIRAVVFDMNHPQPSAPATTVLPQVLPLPDQALFHR